MDVITWEEYFMGIAMLAAQRSKDPSTQVGCCIVRENKILSIGYNGMPFGCDDNVFPWEKEGEPLNCKYMYVVHAELNAILNSTTELTASTLYTSLFPCNECCKAIIQSGIKEIVYLNDKYGDSSAVIAGKRMLNSANILYREFVGNRQKIEISLSKYNT